MANTQKLSTCDILQATPDKVGSAGNMWSIRFAIGQVGKHYLLPCKPGQSHGFAEQYWAYVFSPFHLSWAESSILPFISCPYCNSPFSLQHLLNPSIFKYWTHVICNLRHTAKQKLKSQVSHLSSHEMLWTQMINFKKRIHQCDYTGCQPVIQNKLSKWWDWGPCNLRTCLSHYEFDT